MSLANKYRPQTFDQVIDQSHIVDILKYQVANGQTSQTYIFFGPRGTGKTSTARILSKAINCLQSQGGNPCNMCINCQTITANKSVDFIEIDAASHTGVDNIREEIISKVSYPPMGLKKKIYLIDEVHMLSKGAFNSLLKIMEETPEYMIFVLATTEINKVPDTILSRCQIFNFTKVMLVDMVKHLSHICDQEGLQYEIEALELIASVSDGCVRDAVKYVDQVSLGNIISIANVSKYIGIASQSMIKNFLQSLATSDFDQILTQLDIINQSGIDLYNYTKQLLHYIDQHYRDDIPQMSNYAQLCSTILTQQKYYPNPMLAYKVELWKYCQSDTIKNITQQSAIVSATDDKKQIKQTDINHIPATQTITNPDNSDNSDLLKDTPHHSDKVPDNNSSDTTITQTIPGHRPHIDSNIHDTLYPHIKISLQKIIGQTGKFVRSDDHQTIQLVMIDSGKMSMIDRPDTIKYLEELIQSYIGAYSLHIIYHDPQTLLDHGL